MKITEFRKLIREEVKLAVQERRNTPKKNALELFVEPYMDSAQAKAAEAGDNMLLSAMKELDSKLRGKTISVPGEWQGTIISVIPTLKSNREPGMRKAVRLMKEAEPGIKVKVTSVQEPGDYDAKVGKVIDMDYYSWVNYDVELV